MGKAISLKMRLCIVNLYKEGINKSEISKSLKIHRTTVHSTIGNNLKNGENGLTPKYHNCGKQLPSKSDFGYRACCLLKRWHPTWGAERIMAEIAHKRPDVKLKNLRTVQRWIKQTKAKTPENILPKTPKQWAKSPHEGWQIDAKEEIELSTKKNAVG